MPKVISTADFNNTASVFGDSDFNSIVYLSSENSKAEARSMENNMAIIDNDECQDILKAAYNLTEILISKTEEKDGETKQFNIEYYNPKTREKLDESLCQDNNLSIKMPLLMNVNETRKYTALKRRGIDAFDINDPAFNSYCYPFVDNQTGYDTTLNYRINNYLNDKNDCQSNGCEYTGINGDNSYIQCHCKGSRKHSKSKLGPIINNNVLSCVSKVKVILIFM
jgi:hypothetical protein